MYRINRRRTCSWLGLANDAPLIYKLLLYKGKIYPHMYRALQRLLPLTTRLKPINLFELFKLWIVAKPCYGMNEISIKSFYLTDSERAILELPMK
jgi:hypothetical protein